MKRMNFNVGGETKPSKCQKMHIGRNNEKCHNLSANGKLLEDVHEISYLGDLVSRNSKNSCNIKNRVSKGVGLISDIFNILESTSFGPHYFQIALLLRRSLLINGSLFNSDVWYNMTENDFKDISYLDKVFFSRLYSLPKKTPTEGFYLENGEIDLKTEIKVRRLIYFHNLLKRDKSQVVYSYLQSQIAYPSKGDWIYQIYEDMKDFELPDCHTY